MGVIMKLKVFSATIAVAAALFATDDRATQQSLHRLAKEDDKNIVFSSLGETPWAIGITESSKDDPTVKLAESELRRAFEKVTGATIPTAEGVRNGWTILLGADASLGEDEVHVYFANSNLHISGGNARSVLHGTYWFLQNVIGVRWLWPGEDGERMPDYSKETFVISKDLNFRHTPKINYRGLHTCGDWFRIHDFRLWMSRNFVNVHRHGGGSANSAQTAQPFIRLHSTHNIYLPGALYAEHPEYFAEINGQRRRSQICFNNPEVDRLIYENFVKYMERNPLLEILSVFPSDNQEYCQCVECAGKGVSTSWFDFYNRLTDRLKADYPKLKFATIAYQGYIDVPANKVRNTEFVEYATYSRCNIHKYGDKRCEANAKVLQKMKDWAATGVTMGNYGYEFDIFSGAGTPFSPYYSMLSDAVKMTPKLGQIALITEVGLSPRNGPEVICSAFQDRLGEYIYAQLMWDTDADVYDIIADWCNATYGRNAGRHMFEYFKLLDRRWDSMDTHRHILGRPTTIAPLLMTPEVKVKAADLLDKAMSELKEDKSPNAAKYQDALKFDQQLFAQWTVLLAPAEKVSIPRIEEKEDFKEGRGAWTKDALMIREKSPSFTVELSTGLGGETWNFKVRFKDSKEAWKISAVGVKEEFNAEWDYKDGVVTIPFASLGITPAANAKWQIRIATGVKAPSGEPAMLHFCSSPIVGRKLLWWPGSLARDKGGHPDLIKGYEDKGWDFTIAKSAEEYKTAKPDVYYFRNPGNTNPFPSSEFDKVRENVKNGTMAVFVGYSYMPLEKYFDDPTFKVGVGGTGKILLSQRKTKNYLPGDWVLKPHDMRNSFARSYTPAYNLVPDYPDKWTVLATLPYNGEPDSPERPYIMMRKYGKGIVLVIAADPWVSIPNIIENILANPPPSP